LDAVLVQSLLECPPIDCDIGLGIPDQEALFRQVRNDLSYQAGRMSLGASLKDVIGRARLFERIEQVPQERTAKDHSHADCMKKTIGAVFLKQPGKP
jgi:hypothetical protein